MKKYLSTLVALFIGLAAALPTFAADTYRFKGQTAQVYNQRSAGCVSIQDFIIVNNDESSGAGMSVYLSHYVQDICTSTVLSDASGSIALTKESVQFSKDMVRLTTTFGLYDFALQGNVQFTLDLSWIGDGNSWAGNSISRYTGVGYRVISRSVGTSQNAMVTGTLNNVPLNTYGSIDTMNAGSVAIFK